LIASYIVAVQKISMILFFSRFSIFFLLFYKTDLLLPGQFWHLAPLGFLN